MTNLSTYFPQRPDYTPPMMQFDGASYYSKSHTPAGNKLTICARFKVKPRSGNSSYYIFQGVHNSTKRHLLIGYDAETNFPSKIRLAVQNSAGTLVCRLTSTIDVDDDSWHTVFAGYDGDAGTAFMYVDGLDVADTGHADHVLTTGTLSTTAGTAYVGAETSLNPLGHFIGNLGFLGVEEAYLTNWQDFMDNQGNPKALDQFGWTEWGGGTFAPATQLYDGSTGYFIHSTPTTSGNKVTTTARFKLTSFTGGGAKTICQMLGPTNYRRVLIQAFASDHSTMPNRLYVQVRNSANTTICQLVSLLGYIDGQPHTLFFSFDGDAGAAVFRIDGANADDTGHGSRTAPTTGTLDTGASSEFLVGARTTAPADAWSSEIGLVGYADAYLTNWGDFMDATGVPQEIDELNWTEWGGQPLFWNKYAAMDDNKGSAGNMTRTGTVTHTPNSQPLFWHEAAKMDEQLGSAGVMTESGTVLLGKGGN